MMGRQTGDQSQLFYSFNLEERIPERHLPRRLDPISTRVLVELREKLRPFYSEISRPSIDHELMLRMLGTGSLFVKSTALYHRRERDPKGVRSRGSHELAFGRSAPDSGIRPARHHCRFVL